MKLKSYFNPNRDSNLNQVVQVRLAADAAPAAPFVLLGDIIHEEGDNASGMQKHALSHAIYSHVQELLYLRYGIQDMQKISITTGGGLVLPVSWQVNISATAVKVGQEIQIDIKMIPANATIDGFYLNADNNDLLTITNPTAGNYTVKFKAEGEAILEAGVINSQFSQIISIRTLAYDNAVPSKG